MRTSLVCLSVTSMFDGPRLIEYTFAFSWRADLNISMSWPNGQGFSDYGEQTSSRSGSWTKGDWEYET
jgi:hypothetical protein